MSDPTVTRWLLCPRYVLEGVWLIAATITLEPALVCTIIATRTPSGATWSEVTVPAVSAGVTTTVGGPSPFGPLASSIKISCPAGASRAGPAIADMLAGPAQLSDVQLTDKVCRTTDVPRCSGAI